MKLSAAALLLLSGLLFSCGDDVLPEKVPVAVRQTLLTTFPTAAYIEWERKGKEYEADFAVTATEHSALFNSTGSLLQHKRNIPAADLPEKIKTAIQEHYAGYQVDDAEEFVKNEVKLYQVELKNDRRETKVVFSADGKPTNQPFWD